jgi:hypothetical protein
MGHAYLTTNGICSTRESRLGWRRCLRKGCGRLFRATRYNQRYCQQPDCLREVRRWQAAKRQRKCRAKAEGRRRHAEAERQRRASPPRPPAGTSPAPSASPMSADSRPGAWSRGNRHPEIFCDRPGCYEPPRDACHACYCGPECAAAMRQVQDRQRKWLRRNSDAGRFKRCLEYELTRAKRCGGRASAERFPTGPAWAARLRSSVLISGSDGHASVGFSGPEEVKSHDPKTSAGPRPRAPPAP